MTIEAMLAGILVALVIMGLGVYRTWSDIKDVKTHTNSMHTELVDLKGVSELARGKLIGKQEAVKYITDSDIERAAKLVATRVGDLVIAKLLQNHRFVPKEEETK